MLLSEKVFQVRRMVSQGTKIPRGRLTRHSDMKVIILFVVLALVLFSNTYCGPNKEEYESKYLCGEAAAAAFKRGYGDDISVTQGITASYTCHYNKKLKKCFMLVDFLMQKDWENMDRIH